MMKRPITVGLILLLNFAFCTAKSTGWRCNSGNFKCGTAKCIPLAWVCDSEDDCGDTSDEKDCASRECQQGHFRCASGKCISDSWRCDGENDCKDGSDEKGCVRNKTCGKDHFTCANHQCIPKARKCDHSKDCVDGSDESDCPPKVCKSGEFSCNNRRCIKEDWVCDGEDDCGDNSDEHYPICSKSTKPSCKPYQFACKSTNNLPIGGCIDRRWKCDGKRDCRDGSDEEDCPANVRCDERQYKCANGTCIDRTKRCDSKNDCPDGDDEKNCVSGKNLAVSGGCDKGEFRCASGECISKTWLCDGEKDCLDGSDENLCARNKTCGQEHFACANHQCIPKAWTCDNATDCLDGSDETDCHQPCATDEFKCEHSKKCISLSKVCDSKNDCGFREDEPKSCNINECKDHKGNCSQICTDKKIGYECSCRDGYKLDKDGRTCEVSGKNLAVSGGCDKGEFRCASGECISKTWLCDGEKDCLDGSDENLCVRNKTCGQEHFACANHQCIPKAWTCDNATDCLDGSDETDCHQPCATDEFKCENSKKCISLSKVCDSKNDCGFREDEPKSCNINECKDHNGNCSQICTDKNVGYECSCRDGYKLDKDGRTCEDINECAVHGSCSQICENTESSFKCSCQATYILEANQRSCKAIGQKPFLLFSDRHNIKISTFEPHGKQDIAKGLPSVIGITFDVSQEHIYWADHRERALKSAALSKPDNYNLISRLKPRAVPDDVAVDWVGRKIYWSDNGLDTIEVAELDGTSGLILVNTGLDEPRGIAVDPTEKGRHIYWTDWGREAKIEKISMDGDPSTRVVLHNLTGGWPNGITIDFTTRRVFWTDARRKVIESSSLDGSDRRQVVHLQSQHPFSVTVFEDFVYWSDWQNDAIFKTNKFTGNGTTRIVHGLYSIMGVEIYHALRQPAARNPCGLYNGGCSHLCLLSSKYGYTCACPTGVNLLRDKQTCNTTSTLLVK